jgi:hypothetical protein
MLLGAQKGASPASMPPGVQLEAFLQYVEVHGVGLWAKRIRVAIILDPEHGFVRLDEWREQVTFIILETLLVECPIKV